MNPSELQSAATALHDGRIVAYPTEAVYGLGCDPANTQAVQRLLRLKQRPVEKGLILIAASLAQLVPWIAPLGPALQKRVMRTWPGPVTWLLPAATGCPKTICGQHDTVAVRITAHPVAAALCHAFGGALVSTSANLAGQPPLRSADAVRAEFGDALAFVIDGEVGNLAGPTPIRDARSGATVREQPSDKGK